MKRKRSDLLVRKPLSNKVNSIMTLYATFGGLHLPKGGSDGHTILLKNINSAFPPERISDHMWTQAKDPEYYSEYQNGDRLKIVGKVIKYFKYSEEKPQKDFAIQILACEKVGQSDTIRNEKTDQRTS